MRRKCTLMIESNQPIAPSVQRAVAALDRRATLRTVGMALLATMAHPGASEAARNRDRKRKKKRGRGLCSDQEQQCHDALQPLCRQAEDPEFCEEVVASCCDYLSQCNPSAFIVCMVTPPEETSERAFQPRKELS